MKAVEADTMGSRKVQWLLFNSKTYAMILYLLLALPLGIIYFTVAVTGIALSIGLTPIFIGIPLFFVVAKLLNQIVKFEQGMIRQILGLPSPPSSYSYTQQHEAQQSMSMFKVMTRGFSGEIFIRDLLLILLKFVTGIVFFVVMVTFLSVGLALMFSPIVHIILLETIQIDIFENSLFSLLSIHWSYTQQYILYVALGAVISWAALHIVKGLMQIQGRMMMVEVDYQQQPPAPVGGPSYAADLSQYDAPPPLSKL